MAKFDVAAQASAGHLARSWAYYQSHGGLPWPSGSYLAAVVDVSVASAGDGTPREGLTADAFTVYVWPTLLAGQGWRPPIVLFEDRGADGTSAPGFYGLWIDLSWDRGDSLTPDLWNQEYFVDIAVTAGEDRGQTVAKLFRPDPYKAG